MRGVTIINIDMDHLYLPSDLRDYYDVCPSVTEFDDGKALPSHLSKQKDMILPPLPKVNEIDLYVEVHILFTLKSVIS